MITVDSIIAVLIVLVVLGITFIIITELDDRRRRKNCPYNCRRCQFRDYCDWYNYERFD